MSRVDLEREALTVLDSMHQHIALLDPAGNILAVNQAWRAFGAAEGSAGAGDGSIGLNYFDVCDGEQTLDDPYARLAREGISAVLAGARTSFELEYPCHGPGPGPGPGRERWFLLRVSPLRGHRPGAVISHEDITERWHLTQQRATLVSELLDFKAAIDAHAIVAITDSTGRITYANDKFCAISKWPREELLGHDHRVVNSGHHPRSFFDELWASISSGKVWKGELKNRARDGSIYWVDTTIIPVMTADGRPHQYIAIRAETTQRKLLEERNESMVNELVTANRELSEFAYVVSHDLKAPLRAISSLANWLLADSGPQLGEEGRAQLGLIASRVKRLAGMIDAILAYSRAGRSNDQRMPVALEPLVRNTIDLLAPPAHVRIEIADPLPELRIQAVQIQQVFQNLLSNAIDFMDKPQGRVVIGCRREPAGGELAGVEVWHFSVADNGRGIEERHFERIFHLFQTLAARDEMERTGVGLALVKKIVEIESGRLWVESTPGVGTTFHFTLPAGQTATTTGSH